MESLDSKNAHFLYLGWDGGFVLLVSTCLLAMAFLAPTLWHQNMASSSREEVLA
jgi:OPA family glycerol-3-phosphate transporter-like MFS transporter